MKDTILMLLGGLIAGLIIMYLKDFILKKFKKEIPKLIPEEEKTKLLDLYNKGLVTLSHLKNLGIEVKQQVETEVEKFNGEKLVTGMLKVNNSVLWAKDFQSIFNLRKLLIVGVIIGCIYGWGWYQGQMGKPVVIDWRGKEEFVKLNDHYLHIQKDGSMQVLDSDKKTVLKDIKVKDLDGLRKYLKPYGFIFEPIGVIGGGISNANTSFEGGIGVRYLKYFKWVADIALTNKGFYPLGISYKITDNSAIGLSAGTGYQKLERGFFERFLIKYTWRF